LLSVGVEERASLVVRGINAGVYGFNRWSFTNRGDLDGQWRSIKTSCSKSSSRIPTPATNSPCSQGSCQSTPVTVNYQMDGNYQEASNTTYLDKFNFAYY
jgi:hypothetical protein